MDKLLNVTIRPMNEHDLDAVVEIETESFSQPWSRVHFISELNSPHSFPLVAHDSGGSVMGYICPMLVLDEGEILDVAVSHRCRNKGVGKLLVEEVLDECRKKGASFVSLEVRKSNISAISLYKSLGFIETGQRKRYYENGEDAILMDYTFSYSEEHVDAV